MADYNKIAAGVGSFFQPNDWKMALASKGKATILDSNKAINPFPTGGVHAGGMMSGIPRAIANVRHGDLGMVDAIKKAHKTADDRWDYAAIAGSYMGVSAAYRLASGGGISRDQNGNPNVIGIPFV
ncbi:hypothetical protein [Heyndrickxia sporothermodurans]|jgi:hypothetical protein|uniref:hypothetical protein n=1 Tax=Heyndrickxia sporothermodurans TaxID=46224 RepID=UPI000D3A8745|nr:hypothetical protein [Heyndrickxia sporothermodurans]PTY92906.1 hypothetical protein B5V90_02170 [Heyndrickxia sporothermodurans]